MASSRPKLYPCQQKQLGLVDLVAQPATHSAQNATSTWAFSPARPSNFHFGRAPAATSAPTPSAHATAAVVRSPPTQTDYEKKWLASSGEAPTESCGVLQRLPRLASAPLNVVIWGGWLVWDVRKRSESLVWTEICPCEPQVQVGAMSENEVARSKTRVAVRPHRSAAPRQGRHACPPLPWPPPGEMIRRPLWPPGWDRWYCRVRRTQLAPRGIILK